MDADSPAPIDTRRVLAAGALMTLVALIVYWPALGGSFVFDDDALIANNHLVKASDGLFRIWFTTESLDYWPVTNSSFWVEWRLWGTHAAGYHMTNLALHVCSGLLLWTVLRRLSVPGALLAGLLFVAHPVNVESVAWIAQRKNSLSMVFLLMSALWYLKDDRATEQPAPLSRTPAPRRKTTSRPGTQGDAGTHSQGLTRWWWLSIAAFVLAMLSKGSVAILPAALLLVIWWKRGVVRARDVWRLTPFLAVALVLTLVNIWFQQHYMMGASIREATVPQRLLGAATVIWFYLYKAIAPFKLMFVYPQWTIRADELRWWLPLAAATIATVVLWRLRRTDLGRPLFVAWIFFCLALIPVMGLTDVYFMKYSLVADHYQHVALLAVVTLVAAAVPRRIRGARMTAGVGAAMVCILAGVAWQQSRQYVSAETLYRSTLARNPEAWMAHANLGLLIVDGSHDDVREALDHFQKALQLNPQEPKLHNNVGVALFRLGRYAEAADRHRAAAALSPGYADAHASLGADLQKLGRHRESIEAFTQALRVNPALAVVHQGLAVEWLALGQVDRAAEELRLAKLAHVDNAEGHGAMGDALLQRGRTAEAIAEYRKAVQLDPESERVLTNLGYALTAAGQLEEAERQLRRAAQLNPTDAVVHDYLGNVLLDSQRLPEALAEFNTALRLASAAELPAIHNDLAIALGQAGRVDEAIAHLREALRLKPDFAPARANLALTRRR